ncbi:MAG TPA: DinB family protein [Pyrinomonadaceae bacterium]|jgi:uncharacterized damage-inducible protein DinB
MTDAGEAFIAHTRLLLKSDYLPKLERCLEKLSDDEVWWRADARSNSIGNLLLHLAGNARQWIVSGVGSEPDARARQAEFDAHEGLGRAELLERVRRTIDEADAVLARVDAARLLERRRIQECDVSVLEAVFHAVEHFSMHTGQIILITKMLTQSDLHFYDFSTGVPVQTWHQEAEPE